MKTSKLLSVVSILAVLFSITACNKKKRVETRTVTETKTVTKSVKNPLNASLQKKFDDLRKELDARDAKTEQEAKENEELMTFLQMNWILINDEGIILDKTFLDNYVVAIKTYLELQKNGYTNNFPKFLSEIFPAHKDALYAMEVANGIYKEIKQVRYPSENVKNATKNLKAAKDAHEKLGKAILGEGLFDHVVTIYKNYDFFKNTIEISKKNIREALKVAKSTIKVGEKVTINGKRYSLHTLEDILKDITFDYLDKPKFKDTSSQRVALAAMIVKSINDIDKAKVELVKAQLQDLVKYQMIFERNFKATALSELPNKLEARHRVLQRLAKSTKKAGEKAVAIGKKVKSAITIDTRKITLKGILSTIKSFPQKAVAVKNGSQQVMSRVSQFIWDKEDPARKEIIQTLTKKWKKLKATANAEMEKRRIEALAHAVEVIDANLKRIARLDDHTFKFLQEYQELVPRLETNEIIKQEKAAANFQRILRKILW